MTLQPNTILLLSHTFLIFLRGGDAASSCAAQSEGGQKALGENPHDGMNDEASVLSALYVEPSK